MQSVSASWHDCRIGITNYISTLALCIGEGDVLKESTYIFDNIFSKISKYKGFPVNLEFSAEIVQKSQVVDQEIILVTASGWKVI